MRFQIILNKDGGTLRTLDLDTFSQTMRDVLEQAGHSVSIAIVSGKEMEGALDEAVAGDCEVVMVGGGDGTVSGAAAKLMDTDKALAVLPAGTMNLFARSLAIPLDLHEAVAGFANGRIKAVDLASANGRIFVHQFSIGLHTKLIRLREEGEYRSRVGKMWGSAKAAFGAFIDPPHLRTKLDIDGRVFTVQTVSVGVTNNLFGEGHLPYADTLEDGVLGVYVTRARARRDLAWAMLKMAMGRWKTNAHIDIHDARQVELTILSSRQKRFGCSIDGELATLEETTTLRVHPRALQVLVPAAAAV